VCAISAAKLRQTVSKFDAKPKYNGYVFVHRLKWADYGRVPSIFQNSWSHLKF